MYQVFQPIAVGSYRHKGNGEIKGVRYWWLAFRNREVLKRCRAEVEGSFLDGVLLKAVEEHEWEWELPRQDIQQKRQEARLEMMEASEAADLFDQVR